MNATPINGLTLREYLRLLGERMLFIVAITLLAGAAALFFALRQAPRFEASAQVLLSPVDVAAQLTGSANPSQAESPDRFASTQARIARIPEIARRTLVAEGMQHEQTPARFLENSSVSSDPSSDLLSFSVSSDRARTAAKLATAYARQFVSYRRMLDSAPFLAAGHTLETRLRTLRASGATRAAAALKERQQQLTALMALQSTGTRVVRPATGATQVRPHPLRALAIGLPVGLLLGVVITLLAHVLDTHVRTTPEVERSLRLPLLGRAPRPPRRSRRRIVTRDNPTSAQAEALTTLRANVELANRIHGGGVLIFTSVAADDVDVKSTIVANVAVSFARAGQQVALVDLDLRRPMVAKLFDVGQEPGVMEVVVGKAELTDALQPVPIHAQPRRLNRSSQLASIGFGGTLRVLPVGTRPSNPTDVIGADTVSDLLQSLRDEADLVLIDAPPLLAASDAIALSMRADAIAVIVGTGHDTRGGLVEARRMLDLTPTPKLGFIASGQQLEMRYDADDLPSDSGARRLPEAVS
jgi:Mrp family chromosome partitioning ATPase/ElaB/YqjD/DUF883 family membrane-anchored ribosome-binding protein